MSKYKVLVTARSFDSSNQDATTFLNDHDCEVVRIVAGEKTVEDQLREEIVSADAVIAGLDVYDKSMIENAEILKVISRYGVGYDKVDLEATKEKGIVTTITPGANGDSVADMAMALMLGAARHVPYMDGCIKGKAQQRPIGISMADKVVGIIGAGRIGKSVAKRCLGFGMKILCYDIYEDEAFKKETGAEYVGLDRIIEECDFITIHTNLTSETENMFSVEQFKKMKSKSVIVNTARGGIIDEKALYDALKSGEIAAAGLDATVEEPPYNSPLMSLGNCILTPHAGASTYEASEKMSMMAAENVVAVLKTGACQYSV